MRTFKNVLIIAFISMVTFACNSDDDSSGNNSAQIIGTWRYTSSTTNGVAETLDDCELMETLTFTSNQVTYTIFEGDDCSIIDSETINYAINGNTISTTFDGETFTTEIETLNSTTLTIKDTDDGDVYTDTYTKI